jgi:hypothetical protein
VKEVIVVPGSSGSRRPMESPSLLVHQMLPSGPATMSSGRLMLASVKVVIDAAGSTASGSMRPMRSFSRLENQRLPSGPRVIPLGPSTFAAV